MHYAINKHTKEHRVISGSAQAMAFAVSDDWRVVKADSEGWIEHYGRECPLALSSKCNVKDYAFPHEDGSEFYANAICWVGLSGTNITHYRPIISEDQDMTTTAVDGQFAADPNAWDGEGLPPVGCECEWSDFAGPHKRVLVMGYYGDSVWLRCIEDYTPLTVNYVAESFRPLRTAAQRAEMNAKQAMNEALDEAGEIKACDGVDAIYAAIREGRIPGVKLEGE